MEVIGKLNFANASQPTAHYDITRTRSRQLNTSYADRLATFQGHWIEDEASARQLAALGHVCDRPGIEALEHGSRCSFCSAFVRRKDSVRAFQGPICDAARAFEAIRLHLPDCIHLAARNPLDPKNTNSTVGGKSRFNAIRKRFDRHAGDSTEPAPLVRVTSMQRRPQRSPFFSLPTELRLEIYTMLMPKLDKVTTILPHCAGGDRISIDPSRGKRRSRDMTQLNILLTCRDVYEEALDVLFRNTTYKLSSTKLMYVFLRHIGAHGRQLLTAVDVICGDREDAIAFALLGSCPKLRTITIRLPRPMLLIPRPATWAIDGIACLLHLSGLENVHLAECNPTTRHLGDNPHDADLLKRELMRPKSKRSSIRWVSGAMDI